MYEDAFTHQIETSVFRNCIKFFTKTTIIISYTYIIIWLFFGLFKMSWGQIFSFNGLIIVAAIIGLFLFMAKTAPSVEEFGSMLGLNLIFGWLVLMLASGLTNWLGLNKITDSFYTYTGIVTRKTNEVHYEHSPGPYGGEVNEEYVHEAVNRELFKKSEEISTVIAGYKERNEMVKTESSVFWQTAYLNGFFIEKEDYIKTKTLTFKAQIPFLFIIEIVIKLIPFLLFAMIVELLVLMVSRGKKSLSLTFPG